MPEFQTPTSSPRNEQEPPQEYQIVRVGLIACSNQFIWMKVSEKARRIFVALEHRAPVRNSLKLRTQVWEIGST